MSFPYKVNKTHSITPSKDLDTMMIESLESYLIKSYETSFETNKSKSTSSHFEISTYTRNVIIEINIYMTVFICFGGIVGNLLSLKVFCSTKIPSTSTRIYLIVLTITDSIFLLIHFLDDTCKEIVTHYQIQYPLNLIDQKLTICRAFALIRSTCRCASPWIIVVFTLERFLVVYYPQHSNIISKPQLAKRLVLIIMIISVLVSLYSPVLSGIIMTKKSGISVRTYTQFKNSVISRKDPQSRKFNFNQFEEIYFEKHCDIMSQYRSVYLYLTLIYTIIVVLLPLVIVSLFNTLLIVRLYNSKDQFASAKLGLHEQEMSYKELRDKKVQIENFKTTWMLVIISASFILLTSPHAIIYFTRHISSMNRNHNKNQQNHPPNGSAMDVIMPLIMRFTELLYILNHSVNFFLYIVSRNSFRKVLKEKLQCNCFSKSYLIKNRTRKTPFYTQYFHKLSNKSSFLNHNNNANNITNLNKSSNQAGGLDAKNLGEDPVITKKTIQPEDYEKYWEFIPAHAELQPLKTDSAKSSQKKKT